MANWTWTYQKTAERRGRTFVTCRVQSDAGYDQVHTAQIERNEDGSLPSLVEAKQQFLAEVKPHIKRKLRQERMEQQAGDVAAIDTLLTGQTFSDDPEA